ncbi:MAG: DNA helicase UvrD [Methanocalculus sp. MSAO_Arc2]|uniref:UvrD-helicase domain-containing protein n=1 Tax=Methanocalculus sp. MSAO_Arc2 TaxID=2293855 RepID=UPI000FF55766|nr:MAG: DNA helicase UvrD [Methanocalculus sp. MSAO_Arc2]
MKGLTDRQAEAAFDHERSLCVVAGAGTGKTHLLVQKYLDLLENRGVAVSEILALTFTDKAAAEMKDRIRHAVMAKEGWSQIQDDLLWANVSTFHSFCAQVLREFPIEAGVEPGFSVLDELALRRIREDAVLDLLYNEEERPEKPHLVSLLRSISPYELRSHLDILYTEREYADAFFRMLDDDEAQVLRAWEKTILAYRRGAADDLVSNHAFHTYVRTLRDLATRYPGTPDSGMEYLRALEPHLEVIASDPSADDLASCIQDMIRIHQTFSARMGQKKNWEADDLLVLREAFAGLRGLLNERREQLTLSFAPDDPFTMTTVAFLKDLGSVFSAYTSRVDGAKKRQNGLEFLDLIRYTHQLFMSDDALVEEHFRRRYRYIMVDEYQDTDPAQSDIISRIIGDTQIPSERLFVVGDPKQSIYLFRRADVTQFAHTRDLIRNGLAGGEVALDRNFRSTPEVMGFVNYLFTHLMADPGKPWEFPYQMLKTERSNESGSVTLLLTGRRGNTEDNLRGEAEMVARAIQSFVCRKTLPIYRSPDGSRCETPRPASYGDIAILIERRTQLPSFVWALRKLGIPLFIHSGPGFYEQQEILDLFSILSFLHNDADDLALFGLLRSPYFGISDAMLFHITEAGSRYTPLWKRLAAYAEDHVGSGVSHAYMLLSSWKEYAGRLELAPLLARILQESGIYAVYGGMNKGRHALANIEKLLQKARSGGASLAEFVEMMQLSIADEAQEGEAQIDLTSEDAVMIMTVHSSKGLEFPVVVVPELATPIRFTGKSLMITDHLHIGVKIADPENGFKRRETPLLTMINDIHRQKEEAERLRLLYVAATRAQDHLILSGVAPEKTHQDLATCRSRMDWVAHTLCLTDDAVNKGHMAITPPGSKTPLQISIISDPDAIPAEQAGDEPRPIIPIPQKFRATPEPVVPVHVEPEEPVFPASQIESLRAEKDHETPFNRFRSALAPQAEDVLTRGSILHEVFRGRDPTTVLRQYGIADPAYTFELEKAYERFLRSEMVTGALEDHREVPFRTRAYGRLFNGKIDRLVKRSDTTWILVDYKTGRCTRETIDSYQVQMAVYRQAAEAILAQPVTPYLYFPDEDRWVEVAINEEEVARRIDEATSNTS